MSNQPTNLPAKLLTLLLACPLAAYGLSNDVEQPVTIEANSVVFNKSAGTAVYAGNVEIKQGTLNIKAGYIEIQAPDNEIQLIKANGNPVSFQQAMDNGKMAVGRAKVMMYFVTKKRLVLDGDAALSQDRDTFQSNHIEYSTATGELKAGGLADAPGEKPGRVRATFYPTNKANGSASKDTNKGATSDDAAKDKNKDKKGN